MAEKYISVIVIMIFTVRCIFIVNTWN